MRARLRPREASEVGRGQRARLRMLLSGNFTALGSLEGRSGFAGVLRRDPCSYCGRLPRRGATLDHIVPESRGGENTWRNKTAACGWCNREKAAMSLLMFLLSKRRRETRSRSCAIASEGGV